MRSDPHAHSPTLVLLANSRSSRVRHWRQAALRFPGLSVRVVEWDNWLSGGDELPKALRTARWLRVESPGEDWSLERLLLERGIEPRVGEGAIPFGTVDLDRLTGQRGTIVAPRQWYLGLCRTVREIDALLDEFPHVQSLTPGEEIIRLFDKGLCQPRFREAGLPVPGYFLGIPGYDQLRAMLPGKSGRWMLKLRHGFSALGATALHWEPGRVRALTTTEIETTPAGDRLLLSKRLQSLTDERQIARLVDRLAPEGLIVESWLPKRLFQGLPFDLRCVVIDGKPRHLLGRAAASPFTNLNLNGRRVPAEDLQRLMHGQVDVVLDHALRAAACFPGMLSVGVDVLVRPDDRLAILEANAFGDYLPDLRDRCETPHEAYLSVLARSCRDGLDLGAGDRDTTRNDRIRPKAEVVG